MTQKSPLFIICPQDVHTNTQQRHVQNAYYSISHKTKMYTIEMFIDKKWKFHLIHETKYSNRIIRSLIHTT